MISGFVIDMDGTIYKGGKAIPGAPGFIDELKKRKVPFVFLTNNSAHGRRFYYEKVRGMGFDVGLENILTSTIATIRYLKGHRPGKTVYPLGSPQFNEEIRAAGITVDDRDPDIVLLAFDTTMSYEKINNAYHFLTAGSELIATHPDDLCPTEDGYDVDIGPFIRLFESITDRKATVIGKPNRRMLEMAAEAMDADVNDLVMVGDRLYTDIKMAYDNGITSVLVLTGETKMGDLEASDVKPTFIVDSVADIPDKVLDGDKNRAL